MGRRGQRQKAQKTQQIKQLELPPDMDEEDIKVKVQRIIRKQKYKKLLDEGGQLSKYLFNKGQLLVEGKAGWHCLVFYIEPTY